MKSLKNILRLQNKIMVRYTNSPILNTEEARNHFNEITKIAKHAEKVKEIITEAPNLSNLTGPVYFIVKSSEALKQVSSSPTKLTPLS